MPPSQLLNLLVFQLIQFSALNGSTSLLTHSAGFQALREMLQQVPVGFVYFIFAKCCHFLQVLG